MQKKVVAAKTPNKVLAFLKKHENRILSFMVCASVFTLMIVSQSKVAFAANGGVDKNGNIPGLDTLKTLAENIVTGIGAIIAVYGGITMGLGFAQDNPDGQSRGIKFIIGGVVMVGVSVVVRFFGV